MRRSTDQEFELATPTNNPRVERFLAQPRRAVWTVAAPMMGGMVIHVLYLVVDTAFVGRLGPAALAGLTIVFPLFLVLMALSTGMGSAITVLVAQAVGRGDLAAAARAGGTAAALGVGIGLGLALTGLLGGPAILRGLGASDAVLQAAWDYFSVIALAAPLPLFSAFLRGLLTGQGDTRTPMLVLGMSTLLNLALDPLFIFTLGFGIRGAAISTALAQAAGLSALLLLVLRPSSNPVRLTPRCFLPRLAPIRRVLALGIPASLGQLIMAGGAILMNRVVATFGAAALAGYGAGTRVDAIVALPILGLASGAVTVIGMFAGASRADLVRSNSLYVLRWALTLALTVGLASFVGRYQVLRIFTSDPQTIAVGSHYLVFMVFVYPMMGIGIVGSRLLLGLGYPNLSLAITSIRVLAVAVPFAYVSVFLLGAPIQSIWWGILCSSATAFAVSLWLVRRMVWHKDPTARAAY